MNKSRYDSVILAVKPVIHRQRDSWCCATDFGLRQPLMASSDLGPGISRRICDHMNEGKNPELKERSEATVTLSRP